jgi:diaminohydroxyphosphoribosylaminopyrimidine deaminase/5-amino-6-(5-phosphoribosylamino)uracil reductase
LSASPENQDPLAALEAAWPALVAGAAGPEPADCPLWPLYAPIAGAEQIVIGQLGQSLDGRVATATGKSRYINGPEAIRHLHRLRALVDAVVVGVGTVTADDPQLTVREVTGPCPARIVIDPNFRMPSSAQMMCDDKAPIYAVQGEPRERPPGVASIVVPCRDGLIPPMDILAALRERGFRRILVEGGATTVSAFIGARALDRLHLSIAPMVIGSGPIGINLAPIDGLDDALRPTATPYPLGADMLFDCTFA